MKRSRINVTIDAARTVLAEHGIHLPPWAHWSPADWASAGPERRAIRINDLGWSVSDFARDDFERLGMVMFTSRNGNQTHREQGTPYAEKLFIMTPGQRIPLHFHYSKAEDIINRTGGMMMMRVYHSTESAEIDQESEVVLACDGVERRFAAGEEFEIPPGESVTLRPGVYHTFWAKAGAGVLVGGEVSTVSDAFRDNHFGEPLQRFTEIEEDEPARYLLGNEYPEF